MASEKISQLTNGDPAQGSDLIPIARSGANRSITPASIAALAPTLYDINGNKPSAQDNHIVASLGTFTDGVASFTPSGAAAYSANAATFAMVTADGFGAPIEVSTDDGTLLFTQAAQNPSHVQVASNVLTVTFPGNNGDVELGTYQVGMRANFTQFSGATFLNNQTVTITGITDHTITANFTHADYDAVELGGLVRMAFDNLDCNLIIIGVFVNAL